MPFRIVADDRWKGLHGIGRFALEVLSRLPNLFPLDSPLPVLHPLDPLVTSLLIRKHRPTVFYTPGFNPPLSSIVPFVFTIHDLIHLKFKEESSLRKKLYYQLLIRNASKKARFIITVSEFSRREIVEWLKLDTSSVVRVVGNGINKNFNNTGPAYRPGFEYLFYLGNRKPHKNIFRMLEAFSISKARNDFYLVMSGLEDKIIAEHANNLGVLGRLRFIGFIPEERLPSVYRGAHAFIMPSLYEGFGLPILEAMGCGIPVIASNSTAIPEVAGGAARLFDPIDTEDMATAIDEISYDAHVRYEFILKGLHQVKRFSWDRTAELVTQALMDAVS